MGLGPTHLILSESLEDTQQVPGVEWGAEPLGFDAAPARVLLQQRGRDPAAWEDLSDPLPDWTPDSADSA